MCGYRLNCWNTMEEYLPGHLTAVFVGESLVVDVHLAGCGLFQIVHAADQGTLAASGGADNNQLFTFLHCQVNVL